MTSAAAEFLRRPSLVFSSFCACTFLRQITWGKTHLLCEYFSANFMQLKKEDFEKLKSEKLRLKTLRTRRISQRRRQFDIRRDGLCCCLTRQEFLNSCSKHVSDHDDQQWSLAPHRHSPRPFWRERSFGGNPRSAGGGGGLSRVNWLCVSAAQGGRGSIRGVNPLPSALHMLLPLPTPLHGKLIQHGVAPSCGSVSVGEVHVACVAFHQLMYECTRHVRQWSPGTQTSHDAPHWDGSRGV